MMIVFHMFQKNWLPLGMICFYINIFFLISYVLYLKPYLCISGCRKDFTGLTGKFETPNYPNLYPRNSFCQWRIRVKAGMRIKLNIGALNIEQNCAYDNVTVYNGYSNKYPVLGQYCSHRKPISLTSSSNVMTVIFISDSMTNGRGFAASYVAVPGGKL